MSRLALGYGVTVAQQSLNLLVKVRILVPQFSSPSFRARTNYSPFLKFKSIGSGTALGGGTGLGGAVEVAFGVESGLPGQYR
jgi:hypothetical protein